MAKAAGSALRVHRFLQRHPLASITQCSAELKLTIPPITKAMENLIRLGLVTETTGRKRNRVFAYQAYLRLLVSDTEPLK